MHEYPVESARVAAGNEGATLSQTASAATEKLPQDTGFLSRLSQRYAESGMRDRAPMAIALFSVVFQSYPSWDAIIAAGPNRIVVDALTAGIVLASVLSLSARTGRLAIGVFTVIALIIHVPNWMGIANHTYLALWTIPVAIVFKEWWKSDLYAFYLRMTLGIVMIAAFSQKILAGTYIDGSYLAYLGTHGGTTERMFSLLCSGASKNTCSVYQYVSIFILAWQLTVGLLLLAGLNAIIFLAVEVGFLLGAGVYADEMNFQVLNIALLCIVFRFGMPLWLAAICVPLLILDLFSLSKILDLVVSYVA
jgi:hypothetical protein